MNLNILDGWRKNASQMVDDNAVEKAFADQSYGFIANKAGILMHPPHQLGFEIVHKNDANTRMVGIYAFRMNDALLYAPVFFLNGEIKGTDLLYRHNVKRFTPLDEEWVNYLREFGGRDVGTSIDRRDSRKIPQRMRLDRLAYPPHIKGANRLSAMPEPPHKRLDNLPENYGWGDFLDEMSQQKKLASNVLRDFMAEHATPTLLDKLASLIERSVPLAEVFAARPQDSYLPPEMLERFKPVKEAAAPDDLVLYIGMHAECVKSGSALKVAAKGYTIDDKRDEAGLTAVYEDMEDSLMNLNSPGVCDALMANGEVERVMILVSDDDSPGAVCPASCGDTSEGTRARVHRDLRVVHLNGTPYVHQISAYNRNTGVWGKPVEELHPIEKAPELKDSMETGKFYMIVNLEGGKASNHFKVHGKSSRGPVTEYEVFFPWESSVKLLVHNKDHEDYNISEGTVGSTCRFIEVAAEKPADAGDSPSCCGSSSYECRPLATPPHALGTESALRSRFMGGSSKAPIKKASLRVVPNSQSFKLDYQGKIMELPRMHMAIKMARDLSIHADSAEELLDEAATKGLSRFLLWPKEAGIHLREDPVFREDYDPTFGIPLREPERHAIPTQTTVNRPAPNRIGDAWDPSTGGTRGTSTNRDTSEGLPHEMLMSASPEEIAQYAQVNQSSQVFDHGMVGSLLQTYDAASAVDQYIPKMEDGVDALGRSLFLFYWKPTDFEQAYGSDDMRAMEDKLLSVFKSFGKVVLDLLRKTKKREANPVSL